MSTNSINLLAIANSAAEADPVYGPVYRALRRTHIGSWADANDIYSSIRRDLIWADLGKLTSGKPTKDSQAKAQSMLDELRELTGVGEVLPKAELAVQRWSASSSSGRKKRSRNGTLIVNSFATLVEASDEDSE